MDETLNQYFTDISLLATTDNLAELRHYRTRRKGFVETAGTLFIPRILAVTRSVIYIN